MSCSTATSPSDAFKVLDGMFFGPLVLPKVLAGPLHSLGAAGISFGNPLAGIHGSFLTAAWLAAGFVLILGFRNSVQQMEAFRLDVRTLVMTIVLFVFGVLSIVKTSEFLYFNF